MADLIIKAAEAARRAGRPMYVYATAVTWVIGKQAPIGNRAYNKVGADGTVTFHAYEFERGTWAVTTLGQIAA